MSKPMGRPGGRGPMSVNLEKAKDALHGKTGTIICKEKDMCNA